MVQTGSGLSSMSPVRVLDTRNATGIPTTSPVGPGGTTRPTASNLNLAPGDIRPNQVTVTFGANRTVSLYNHAGNTHLVADLAGYYNGYALRADGTVWSWGRNEFDSLGNDSVADHSIVPVRVDGLSGVSAVHGVSSAGFALVP